MTVEHPVYAYDCIQYITSIKSDMQVFGAIFEVRI